MHVICPVDSKAHDYGDSSMQENIGRLPAVGVRCKAQQDMTQDKQSAVQENIGQLPAVGVRCRVQQDMTQDKQSGVYLDS